MSQLGKAMSIFQRLKQGITVIQLFFLIAIIIITIGILVPGESAMQDYSYSGSHELGKPSINNSTDLGEVDGNTTTSVPIAIPTPTPLSTPVPTPELGNDPANTPDLIPTPTATTIATPTQTYVATPTTPPTPSPTASATSTPVPTPTPTASPIPTLTATPVPTSTPTPTASPTPTSTPTPTASPTASPEPTPIPTASPIPTSTPTPTASPTPTSTPTPTASPTASPEPTPIPTASPTPTSTPTPAATPTPSPLPTPTPTASPIPSAYYVASNGSDSNPGTATRPWKTIQKAADTLVAGESVYIRQGTYHEHVIVANSGSQGKFITFQNYPGETVVIDGEKSRPTFWSGLFSMFNKQYIKVIGLKMVNSNLYGILADSCDHIYIQDCEVFYSEHGGIVFEGGSNAFISNCDVHHNNDDVQNASHEAISFDGVNTFEVEYCQVHHNEEEGIDAKYGATNGNIHHNNVYENNGPNIYIDAANNINIFNNRVHNTSGLYGPKSGIMLSVEASYNYNQDNLYSINLYNNLIYNNYCGISFWTESGASSYTNYHDIYIVNNVIYNNTKGNGCGFEISNSSPEMFSDNLVIRNNIFWENIAYVWSRTINGDSAILSKFTIDHNLFKVGEASATFGSAYTIASDVKWINKANHDFHLQSDSPAIDAGSAINAPSIDYDDGSRPTDGDKNGTAIYDIGAYEAIF